MVALAQTGTGKTAAYGLPILQKVDAERKETQALILSPTRELCLQIADDLENYSKYLPGVRVLPVYGGTNISTSKGVMTDKKARELHIGGEVLAFVW